MLIKLRSGDQKAFNALYQAYERKVYYNLRKIVHIPEIAAELHQDVFLKVWKKREYVDPEISFESFLITITRNCAIDFYRKAARDKNLMDQLVLSMTEIYDPIADIIAFKETSIALEAAIDKLPPQRRLVFRRIKMEHESYENTAKHFGVSVGTIKDHMAKAMLFIRNELSDSKLLTLPVFVISIMVDAIYKQF